MKYVPKDLGEAAEISNAGHHGWTREIVTLLGGVIALMVALYAGIGAVVEVSLPLISVERERAWFGHLEPSGFGMSVLPEEEFQEGFDRAQRILAKLSSQPGVPPLDYRLRLIADDQPNAFAFPGGVIGVTTGLLETVEEDEIALAFVIAHELGHFAQRDHLRGLGRAVGRTLAWGIVFGGGPDGFADLTGGLLDRAYSRGQESGADRFGLDLVLSAYGTAEGADKLFRWLERAQLQPAWATWLSTHPNPADRIQALRRQGSGGE